MRVHVCTVESSNARKATCSFYTRIDGLNYCYSHPAETSCSTIARLRKKHEDFFLPEERSSFVDKQKRACETTLPLYGVTHRHSIYRAARSDRPTPSHAYRSYTVTTVDNRNKSLLRVETHHTHRASSQSRLPAQWLRCASNKKAANWGPSGSEV